MPSRLAVIRPTLTRRALTRRTVLRAALAAGVAAPAPGQPVSRPPEALRSTSLPTSPLHLISTGLPTRQGAVALLGGRAPAWFGLEGPGIVSSFPSTDQVVLTFDACGGSRLEHDAELIEVLRRHQAPATLFVNRSWAVANWRTMSELVADPLFEIANHGDRHVPLSVDGQAAYGIPGTASVEEAYDEIARAHRLLRVLWGIEPRWFRPGTAHLDDVSAELAVHLGTPVVGFTVNGDLGATAPARQVTANLLTLAPGGIVLAHMNRPGGGTAAGVDAAVPLLRERGLSLRRLDDVL
ncbi:polysaccharide deacetylase family protein [Ornithinimicrobium avium]|uniref:Polysaccharide deacetylase n=1 Tax=Ornithinimicrobium avium TaxID=2283195 RepID=A0A345NNQ3_9MICO|nr:polysaccharide deacetylase family protein [Ornithinimicrobium avium]AXH96661.1 polysaccharide deacetylase [Ornithinimicrobium avium]